METRYSTLYRVDSCKQAMPCIGAAQGDRSCNNRPAKDRRATSKRQLGSGSHNAAEDGKIQIERGAGIGAGTAGVWV